MYPANYTAISFPWLHLELNPGRAIQIGPLQVHYYGIVIALGLVLAVAYASKRCHNAGLSRDDLMDGVLWITPLAIVCARIYYCAFSWDAYRGNPISVLYIWEGGLAIYGGVIGAVIGVAIFCKIKKANLLAVLDLTLTGFLIGQSIGRWGNFFNREAFGAPTECFMRMGLYNSVTQNWEYYHPTFLYESIWNAIGFLLLNWAYPRRRYNGQIALAYCVWYGLGRSWIEGLRMDSLYWGNVRISQALAAATCIIAGGILIFRHFRPGRDGHRNEYTW